jgi:hypothetical protein
MDAQLDAASRLAASHLLLPSGSATAITTTTMAAAHGMDARLIGPSRAGVCKPYRHGPWDYGGPRWGVVSLTVRRPNTFEAASLGGLFFFNFNRARYRIAKNETSLRNFRSRIELLRLVWGEPEVPFDVRTSSAEFRCACIDVLQ